MLPSFRKLLDDRRGAAAIEYGLIVALVVIVAVVGISALGNRSGGLWGNVAAQVVAATPTG
ncbi:pilus assembly protein Flp/PilA [Sphingomonas vulcanisoli]|uniref:Pilus assembly protein Flp/PilA n=1 Tax=Sphingomonas vulcanisoli TaxID=1658060 RepID=A0ABX0TUB5_9SPHN|nr:Flp family type IVb pilin [Sphingomonas vulcanisoli]NIJ07759.1 pilus assembly protein Flp/PilA [Sphingomonas vulcanisoli]